VAHTTEPETFLSINGKNVDVNKDGRFSYSLVLKPGVNNIFIIAKDLYGNETKIEHQIEFVKQLTKEEKDKLQQQQKVAKQKEGWSPGTIIATVVSTAVIILVLSFFIK